MIINIRKKTILWFFFSILLWKSGPLVQAQNNTHTGDIMVTTQERVNELNTTLSGKTTINGNVTIASSSDITDLTPLSNITHITGHLTIRQNEALVNLNGLNNLQSIGKFFRVSSNGRLTTLGDFPALMSIGTGRPWVPSQGGFIDGTSIVVEKNSTLSNCFVLINFLPGGTTFVSGKIFIGENASRCSSQSNILSRVYQGDITVSTQADVNALMLTNFDTIRGNVTLGYTTGNSRSNITDLTPLSNITHITENLKIQQNGQLVNLTALDSLQSIGGYFSVRSNNTLTALGNFPALTSIGTGNNVSIPSLSEVRDNVSIVLEDNPILSDCSVLTNFISGGTYAVSGEIHVRFNASTCNKQNTSLINGRTYRGSIAVRMQAGVDSLRTTLANVDTIDGNLIIGTPSVRSQNNITDLTPLRNITHITGNLIIRQNGQLVNLTALDSLQSIGKYFSVYDNERLDSLGNFPNLQSIGEYFSVHDNEQLTTLNFSALQSIKGYFTVYNNAQLASLGNFPVLDSIGEYFKVNNNTQLDSLGNFPDLQSIGEYFLVQNNDRLTTLGNFPNLQSIGEYFSVYDNEQLITLGYFSALMSIGIGSTTVPEDRTNVSIVLEDNSNLSDCLVLIDFLSGGATAVSGDIYINDNATRCSSQSNILSRVYQGDITVSTQEEVNTLLFSLKNIDTIDGHLTIGYTDDTRSSNITDLTPLSDMSHITGNLRIQQNGQLVNLTALDSLQSIGGFFDVSSNDQLTDLGNFPILQSIGGYFSVYNNEQLDSLDNFSALQSIGGYFSVISNDTLTALGNFLALTSIGTGNNVSIPSLSEVRDNVSIVLEDNPRLSDCSVLTNFITGGTYAVSGEIHVRFNASTCNKQNTSLINGRTYRGSIAVRMQAEVDSLRTTLANVDTIDGNLIIGTPSVRSQNNITDLTPLSNITHITGNLRIQQNGQLVNLTELDSLQSIGEYFLVNNNDALTTLGDFTALTSIGVGSTTVPSLSEFRDNVSIVLEDNPRLSDCSVLTNFISSGTYAVSGEIHVRFNAPACNNQNTSLVNGRTYRGSIVVRMQAEVNELSTILADIDTIDGNLIIGTPSVRSQNNITDLTPLSNITHITGNLRIQQNRQLVNLNGLTHLQSIGKYFLVNNNDTLTTLGKFPALTSIGVGSTTVPSLSESIDNISIVVEDNPNLSDCFVLTNFISGGTTAVSGDIYINGNAGMCTNQSALDNTIYRGDVTVTTQTEVNDRSLAGKTIINGNVTLGYTSGNSRSNITDLTPLSSVVRITGNLSIQQNGQLVNLTALNSLQSIGGYFSVRSNDTLTTFGNFSALQSIGGYFSVRSNDTLTTLGNFPALTSIGTGNNVSIPSLSEVRDNVSIVLEDNPRLSDCSVLTNFISGGTYAVSGEIHVRFNSSVCNNQNTPLINGRTYRGSIAVRMQAEVDSLRTTLANIDTIDGNLIIGTPSVRLQNNITDLTPLSNIIHITGNLIIRQNGQLINLNDLTHLQSIKGYFTAYNNAQLASLGNFLDLQSIGEYFSVYENEQLDSLGNFPNLQSIKGYFTVYDNEQLTTLDNFPVLDSIGEYFLVQNNDRLTTLGDLPALQSIGEYFSVYENEQLITLGDFSALMSIGTGNAWVPSSSLGIGSFISGVSIVVERNNILSDCFVLTEFLQGGVTAVSGTIHVRLNATSCNNPSDILSTVYSSDITVSTQAEVNTLVFSLKNINTIGGNVTIGYASGNSRSNITDLTPLSNITHITGNLYIQRNGALVNLNDLTHLQSVGRIFWVSHNRSLETLGSFDSLQNVNGLFFRVSDNASLTTLGTFDSLQNIQGSFEIYDNESLGTLGNFNKLNSIGSFFEVRGNASLISLGQFSSLTHIGSSGELDFYPNLSILVEHNPNLVLCDFLDDFREGGTHAVEGNIRVAHNASECNTSILLATKLITTDKDDTTYSFDVYANVRWKLSKAENADWITSLSLGNNTADPSTITSEDTATITIDHTRILGHATRTTTLTLTAIDENDVELASPAPITIVFRQWGTRYTGDIILTNQAEVDSFSLDATAIFGNLIIGYSRFTNSRSDITHLNSLSNITHIMGNVNIQRNGQLVNLNDLNNLQLIGGYFQMLFNDSLTTLGNFSELQSIGGYFKVRINNALQTLGNFSGLNSIENYVEIEENSSLNNLGNFNHLQNIGGYVDVARNNSLNFLGDFNHLQNIGSYFSVNNNPLLQTLGNFNHLQNIEKHFYVNNNVALFSLGSFSSLTDIGIGSAYVFSAEDYISNDVSIVVEGNSDLVLCSELKKFLSDGTHPVEGNIYIHGNGTGCNDTLQVANSPTSLLLVTERITANREATVTSFTMQSNVRWELTKSENADWITSLSVGNNDHPSTIMGENTATITMNHTSILDHATRTATLTLTARDENDVVLTNPAPITLFFTQWGTVQEEDIILTSQAEVDAFSSHATAIFGNMTIGGSTTNDQSDITDLTPLRNISHVTGYVKIQQNERITHLAGLTHLQFIGNHLEIVNNDSLETVENLKTLQYIRGGLEIADNDGLETLGNFDSLQFIGEYFYVINNDMLLSLGSFPNLTNIGTGHNVYVPSLVETIDTVSIVVEANPNLVLCSWLENFVPAGANAVTGNVYINNNASGCNNTEQINNPTPVLFIAEQSILKSKDDTTSSFNVYANVRWKLTQSDHFDWVTSLSVGNNIHSDTVTGENEAAVTLLNSKNNEYRVRSATLTFTAIDENGMPISIPSPTLTIQQTHPLRIFLSKDSVEENESVGAVIGILSTTTGDNMTSDYVYTLNDNEEYFTIAADTLKTDTTFDFESQSSYEIEITSNDEDTMLTQTFTINIQNANDPPTDITLTDTAVAENLTAGTVIGTLSTVDPDDPNIDNVYTYTVNNDTFSIVQDTLKTNGILDFETKNSHTITITTDDGNGGTFTKDFIIEVQNANDPPTDITLSDTAVAENLTAGTVIGTLSTVDPDNPNIDNVYTYTVNNNTFLIVQDTLKTNGILDFETKNSYMITITTDDGNGGNFPKDFIIEVQNANDPPMDITLTNTAVAENLTAGTVIGTLSTVDPDDPNIDNVYTYTVNNDTFSIVQDTLKTNGILDFETKSSYMITITTDDGNGGTFTKDFIIEVQNANDPPTDIMLSNTIISNENVGEIIGEFTTTDEDKNDRHKYSISGTDASNFNIDENNLKIAQLLDNNQSRYTFSITSMDQDSAKFTKDFVITKENNDPITITLSHNIIKENQEVGTVIGIFTTNTTNTNHTYILGGTDASAFSIVINTLKTTKQFDFETKSTYLITVTTNDGRTGSISQDFTITVMDIDENTLFIDELSENVKILPVVVKDAFNLEMDHPFKGEVQVRLYTLNGAIVKTESYHKSHPVLSKNMEVSYLPGGVYVVNIHFDTFVITKKIVKK